jgi:hypothetical protein
MTRWTLSTQAAPNAKLLRSLTAAAVLASSLAALAACSGALAPVRVAEIPVPAAAASATPGPLSASTLQARPATASPAVSEQPCHSGADCPSGGICYFDAPGCDHPVGRCGAPEYFECRASAILCGCNGAISACRQARLSEPWVSREPCGAATFSFVAGHAPADIRAPVASVVVYHMDDNILTDVDVRPADLERRSDVAKVTLIARAEEDIALDLVAASRPVVDSAEPDCRWGVVFLDAGKQRLLSVYFDKFGTGGIIDGQYVHFADSTALGKLRALFARHR